MRGVPALAAVALLLAGAGCSRVATDPESSCRRYTGTAPLTVRGAAPGQSEQEVVALLGPPDRRNGAGRVFESLRWQRFPDMVVTLDTRPGRVTEVLGNELTADGDDVLAPGMSEADVRAILGNPAKSVGRYRPKGSGVISIGMKKEGTTLTDLRDGHVLEVTLNEGSLAYLRLKPAP